MSSPPSASLSLIHSLFLAPSLGRLKEALSILCMTKANYENSKGPPGDSPSSDAFSLVFSEFSLRLSCSSPSSSPALSAALSAIGRVLLASYQTEPAYTDSWPGALASDVAHYSSHSELARRLRHFRAASAIRSLVQAAATWSENAKKLYSQAKQTVSEAPAGESDYLAQLSSSLLSLSWAEFLCAFYLFEWRPLLLCALEDTIRCLCVYSSVASKDSAKLAYMCYFALIRYAAYSSAAIASKGEFTSELIRHLTNLEIIKSNPEPAMEVEPPLPEPVRSSQLSAVQPDTIMSIPPVVIPPIPAAPAAAPAVRPVVPAAAPPAAAAVVPVAAPVVAPVVAPAAFPPIVAPFVLSAVAAAMPVSVPAPAPAPAPIVAAAQPSAPERAQPSPQTVSAPPTYIAPPAPPAHAPISFPAPLISSVSGPVASSIPIITIPLSSSAASRPPSRNSSASARSPSPNAGQRSSSSSPHIKSEFPDSSVHIPSFVSGAPMAGGGGGGSREYIMIDDSEEEMSAEEEENESIEQKGGEISPGEESDDFQPGFGESYNEPGDRAQQGERPAQSSSTEKKNRGRRDEFNTSATLQPGVFRDPSVVNPNDPFRPIGSRKLVHPLCPLCDYKASADLDLQVHLTEQHGNKQMCLLCQQFTYAFHLDDLIAHIRVDHRADFESGLKEFERCWAYCGKYFKTETAARRHVHQRHDRRYLCTICHFGFEDQYALHQHQIDTHTEVESTRVRKRVIIKDAASDSDVNKSARRRDSSESKSEERGEYLCREIGCDERFSSLKEMRQHVDQEHKHAVSVDAASKERAPDGEPARKKVARSSSPAVSSRPSSADAAAQAIPGDSYECPLMLDYPFRSGTFLVPSFDVTIRLISSPAITRHFIASGRFAPSDPEQSAHALLVYFADALALARAFNEKYGVRMGFVHESPVQCIYYKLPRSGPGRRFVLINDFIAFAERANVKFISRLMSALGTPAAIEHATTWKSENNSSSSSSSNNGQAEAEEEPDSEKDEDHEASGPLRIKNAPIDSIKAPQAAPKPPAPIAVAAPPAISTSAQSAIAPAAAPSPLSVTIPSSIPLSAIADTVLKAVFPSTPSPASVSTAVPAPVPAPASAPVAVPSTALVPSSAPVSSSSSSPPVLTDAQLAYRDFIAVVSRVEMSTASLTTRHVTVTTNTLGQFDISILAHSEGRIYINCSDLQPWNHPLNNLNYDAMYTMYQAQFAQNFILFGCGSTRPQRLLVQKFIDPGYELFVTAEAAAYWLRSLTGKTIYSNFSDYFLYLTQLLKESLKQISDRKQLLSASQQKAAERLAQSAARERHNTGSVNQVASPQQVSYTAVNGVYYCKQHYLSSVPCQFTCATPFELQRHLAAAHSFHLCFHCHYHFKTLHLFADHISDAITHANWQPRYSCAMCCFVGNSSHDLTAHKDQHRLPFKCSVARCLARFATANAMNAHVERVHIVSNTQAHGRQAQAQAMAAPAAPSRSAAPIPTTSSDAVHLFDLHCGRRFTTRAAFQRHLPVNDPAAFHCSLCCGLFNDQSAYEAHIKLHRPLVCRFCAGAVVASSTLDLHNHYIRDHSKWPCWHCGVLLQSDAEHRRHIMEANRERVKDIISDDRNIVVRPCSLCCASIPELHHSQHSQTHCYPLRCPDCGLPFITLKEQTFHIEHQCVKKHTMKMAAVANEAFGKPRPAPAAQAAANMQAGQAPPVIGQPAPPVVVVGGVVSSSSSQSHDVSPSPAGTTPFPADFNYSRCFLCAASSSSSSSSSPAASPSFRSPHEFFLHAIKSHTKFPCLHCRLLFDSAKAQRRHFADQSDEEHGFVCQFCCKTFEEYDEAEKHKAGHREEIAVADSETGQKENQSNSIEVPSISPLPSPEPFTSSSSSEQTARAAVQAAPPLSPASSAVSVSSSSRPASPVPSAAPAAPAAPADLTVPAVATVAPAVAAAPAVSPAAGAALETSIIAAAVAALKKPRPIMLINDDDDDHREASEDDSDDEDAQSMADDGDSCAVVPPDSQAVDLEATQHSSVSTSPVTSSADSSPALAHAQPPAQQDTPLSALALATSSAPSSTSSWPVSAAAVASASALEDCDSVPALEPDPEANHEQQSTNAQIGMDID